MHENPTAGAPRHGRAEISSRGGVGGRYWPVVVLGTALVLNAAWVSLLVWLMFAGIRGLFGDVGTGFH